MKIFPRPIDNTLPIWRAVGGPPASAIKAGKQGVPMMITTLGGPAMNFKGSIDAYRQAATVLRQVFTSKYSESVLYS